jgi:LuxR family transcriptional regulator, quorum-sensing system regulator SolR
MNIGYRHWLGRVPSATNRQELAVIVGETTRALGFERFWYLQSSWLPRARAVGLGVGEHPHDLGHPEAASAVRHCRHSNQPFVWRCATGVCWAQGVSSPRALGVRGILSLTRRGPAFDDEEQQRMEPLLLLVCKALHDAVLRLESPRIEPPLTEREREVLRWTAIGKTTPEVARILALSDNTIKFHIKNASLKLGAVNKTAAVVQAVLSGLLH